MCSHVFPSFLLFPNVSIHSMFPSFPILSICYLHLLAIYCIYYHSNQVYNSFSFFLHCFTMFHHYSSFIPYIHLGPKEMETINAKIAHAAVSGRLEKNPVMQGLLLQCLNRLEREERGVMHNRGRQKASVDLEKALLSEAALSLAILGGNKNLCQRSQI